MYLIMSLKACCEPDGTYGIYVNLWERFVERRRSNIHTAFVPTFSQMTGTFLRRSLDKEGKGADRWAKYKTEGNTG